MITSPELLYLTDTILNCGTITESVSQTYDGETWDKFWGHPFFDGGTLLSPRGLETTYSAAKKINRNFTKLYESLSSTLVGGWPSGYDCDGGEI